MLRRVYISLGKIEGFWAFGIEREGVGMDTAGAHMPCDIVTHILYIYIYIHIVNVFLSLNV